ncbi:molybdate ABC transporter substrate-binding protein [Oscillospiraceae bacterium WX1]
MKKKLVSLILVLLTGFVIAGCGSKPAPEGTPTAASSPSATVTLSISAAASLTAPLNEIKALYEAANPGVTLTINTGASGTLQTQIEQGAPCDVFISASSKQTDALNKEDLLTADSLVNLLSNEIVLIVPASSASTVTSFDDCATDAVKTIAVGNPESVPAGQYAQETFTALGIWDAILAKANLGTDVKQVLSWVESGNVDCGVVYKTDAATDANVKIVAEAPAGSHKPVVYPAVIVKASANQTAAAAFLAYLQSADAMKVFEKYGFSPAA